MEEIKFRYVFENLDTLKIKTIELGIEDIESSSFPLIFDTLAEAKDIVNNIEKNIKLISRDQYTGLDDKNGKEIYEGDILECESSNNTIIICLVEYCQENGQYSTIRYSRGRRAGKCHPFGFSDSNPWYSAKQKIIGNIHENPELLI